MIIDSHVHLSRFNHQGQTFASIRDSLLASMTQQSIDYALVYPDSEPQTDVADLDITLELVGNCPQLYMLGTLSLPNADSKVVSKLDRLAAAGKIVGIKLYPGFELFYPDESSCYCVYELCMRYNLAVVYHSGETIGEVWREEYNNPQRIERVAEALPKLRIVIAHFSQPHLVACRDVVMSKANVYADISGLAHSEVEDCCGKAAIQAILEEVACYQPEKILFGTDWPICDVKRHLELIESLSISDTTKAQILSKNAEKVFALATSN